MHLCLGITPTVQQTMSFERIIADDVNRTPDVLRAASGKVINAARVLHTLGEPACVCVPLGGQTGQFIRADLDAAGIEHDCLETNAATRVCITVIDRAASIATELVEEPRPMTPADAERMFLKLGENLPRARTLILSGTLAPGVGDDFYFRCCQAAQAAGVPAILDARGPALRLALPARPFLVKPNRAELAATLDAPIDDQAALRQAIAQLHRLGAQRVVITDGRRGAVAFDGANYWKIEPLRIDAVSAIGSGDAFAAGLAAAIARGQELPDACRLATACAAANALIPGAGFLRPEDVRRLELLVRAEPW